MAVERHGGGLCIADATLEIVSGPGAGRTFRQDEPCDVWWINGFFVTNLPAGVEVTFRVSAPGYLPVDVTVTPVVSSPLRAMIIELSRV